MIQSTIPRRILQPANAIVLLGVGDHGIAEQSLVVGDSIRGKQLFQVGLTPEQTLGVLIELAKALAVAHQHGVVHRDLKPDNIVRNESEAKSPL